MLKDLFASQEWVHLMGLCIICFIGISILFYIIPFPTKKKEEEKTTTLSFVQSTKKRRKYEKRDWYQIVLLVSLYTIISFYQLGSTTFPTTTWQGQDMEQEVVFELPDGHDFDAIYGIAGEGNQNANLKSYNLGLDHVRFFGSNDNEHWTFLANFNNSKIYRYEILQGDWSYRYVKLLSTSLDTTVSEIGFKKKGSDSFLPVVVKEDTYASSMYPATMMIDEQHKLVLDPTYYDESYFDEVYHPRNAWEIANQQYMYATVHPLFGTQLIALSIHLFGMHPFAWRLMGVIFGSLLLLLLYEICNRLFANPRSCFIGTLLLAIEFMHLVTSRIGTLEPFSVFFILWMYLYMIIYMQTSFYDTPLNKTLMILLKCGIVMGIGFATKWTVCYSAIGLAILFFTTVYKRYQEYQKALKVKQDLITYHTLTRDQQLLVDHIITTYKKNTYTTIGWCFLFFIGIPIVIYWASYIPCPAFKDGYSIANVWKQNSYMYHYHINLDATHPYQSEWYQWIFDIRPIWYFGKETHDGLYHSIACFSHPLITWMGFVSILVCIKDCIVKKQRNQTAWIITVGYLTAFLPWVSLVSRCVFAYHFYPTSFFMILSIVYLFTKLEQEDIRFKPWINAFLVVSVIIFVLFLPVLLGIGVPNTYIKALEWFPTWYFG